ncbi:MAG: hypothetical protein NUW01_07250, partial [Gemmatimonadaceae bacterium]|nr:hypothetical protein [Gemmatimonadaceae bacterium]
LLQVFKQDNSALDITGATFAGALVNRRGSQVKALTAGNYDIDDATNGKFSYAPDATDTNEDGLWEWRTVLTISGETYPSIGLVLIHPWKIA